MKPVGSRPVDADGCPKDDAPVPPQRSIAFRLLGRAVLFSLAVTLVLALLELIFDYDRELKSLEHRLDEIERAYSPSLGESLWTLDVTQLRLQLEGILLLREVSFAEVKETISDTPPFVLTVGERQHTAGLSRLISLPCVCDGIHKSSGVLYVEASLTGIIDSLATRAGVILLSSGARTFLVAFFMFYMMHHLVIRRLLDITRGLDRYDPREPVPPLPPNRRSTASGDELDRMARTLDATYRRLKRDYEKLIKTQRALELSERRYRELIDSLPIALYATDAEGRLTVYNEAAANLFGIRPTLGAKCPYENLWRYNSDRESFLGEGLFDAGAAEKQRPDPTGEAVIRRPDGSCRFFVPHPTPLFDEDGVVAGSVTALIDITERKRSDEALREAAARLEALINHIPGIVFRMRYPCEGQKQLLYVGGDPPSFDRSLRDNELTMSAEAYRSLFHPDDHESLFVDVPRRLRETGYAEHRFRKYRPDGSMVWEHARERVIAHDGPDLLVEGLCIDVTAKMEARQELERQREELRKLEDGLMEARRLAVLGQLTSGIAHDFNNLLGAIMGFAQFIVQDVGPEHIATRHAQHILSAGRRCKGVIDRTLAVARGSTGNRTIVSLTALVLETCDLLRASLPCTTKVIADLPDVNAVTAAEHDQLSQALLNLCVNAHDALGGAKGTVTIAVRHIDVIDGPMTNLPQSAKKDGIPAVETWSDPDDTAWAVAGSIDPGRSIISLSVADTGVGMDIATLRQVFVPFFTTKGKMHGTGLGLALVQSVVLAHGGGIMVRSQLGKGTSVEIVLPYLTIPTDAPSSPASLRPSVPSIPAPMAGGRVLLIDDDLDFGDMLLQALERRGIEVTPCVVPSDALAALDESPDGWDAVVTDQTMPEMRGTDLVRQIKALHPNLPCFICTGHIDGFDEAAAHLAGAYAVIRKPIDIDAFLHILMGAILEARPA